MRKRKVLLLLAADEASFSIRRFVLETHGYFVAGGVTVDALVKAARKASREAGGSPDWTIHPRVLVIDWESRGEIAGMLETLEAMALRVVIVGGQTQPLDVVSHEWAGTGDGQASRLLAAIARMTFRTYVPPVVPTHLRLSARRREERTFHAELHVKPSLVPQAELARAA